MDCCKTLLVLSSLLLLVSLIQHFDMEIMSFVFSNRHEKINTTSLEESDEANTNYIGSLSNSASTDCGAKIIYSSKGVSSSSGILQSSDDKYLYYQCGERMKVIIELCETTRVEQFWIGTTELFAGIVKDFEVGCSNNAKDYQIILKSTAMNIRRLQRFNVQPTWCKYISINVTSNYGHEVICPINEVRVIGKLFMDELLHENLQDKEKHDKNKDMLNETILNESESHKTNQDVYEYTLLDYESYKRMNVNNITNHINEIVSKLNLLNESLFSMYSLKLKIRRFEFENDIIKLYLNNYTFAIKNWMDYLYSLKSLHLNNINTIADKENSIFRLLYSLILNKVCLNQY